MNSAATAHLLQRQVHPHHQRPNLRPKRPQPLQIAHLIRRPASIHRRYRASNKRPAVRSGIPCGLTGTAPDPAQRTTRPARRSSSSFRLPPRVAPRALCSKPHKSAKTTSHSNRLRSPTARSQPSRLPRHQLRPPNNPRASTPTPQPSFQKFFAHTTENSMGGGKCRRTPSSTGPVGSRKGGHRGGVGCLPGRN